MLDSVGYPTGAALTDLNSDNNIDLVICSTGDSILYLYTNDGTGNFSREVLDPQFIILKKLFRMILIMMVLWI